MTDDSDARSGAEKSGKVLRYTDVLLDDDPDWKMTRKTKTFQKTLTFTRMAAEYGRMRGHWTADNRNCRSAQTGQNYPINSDLMKGF